MDMATPTTPQAHGQETAEERFRQWERRDPLPEIPPALLNSADIISYVEKVGILDPFHPEPERKKLKSASYEVDMLGKVLFWEEEARTDEPTTKTLNRGDEFLLKPLSIAFVEVEPVFRLPYYIALRFNLTITNVYRGLLLGTGPLIDPGFEGKIYVPLHNLTDTEYCLRGGDGLIWMEFTKLSPHREWCQHVCTTQTCGRPRQSDLRLFPKEKTNLKLREYLRKANPNGAVRSSIPGEVHSAQKAAKSAVSTADRARDALDRTAADLRSEFAARVDGAVGQLEDRRREFEQAAERQSATQKSDLRVVQNWNIASFIAIVVGVIAVAIASWQLWFDVGAGAVSMVQQMQKATAMQQERLGVQAAQLDSFATALSELERRLPAEPKDIDARQDTSHRTTDMQNGPSGAQPDPE